MATDLFAGVMPFIHTAEEHSFGRAAARLGVSTAAVSKAIARLEASLGVALLERSSRRVSLTAAGELYLARCREAVEQLRAGRELVATAHRAVEGVLRVSISPVFGTLLVGELTRLAARHPQLSFELRVTDERSRLLEDDVDVAVRMGPLESSALVARALRTPRWVTAAAPSYLARRGVPRRPEDLREHAGLVFLGPRGKPQPWSFRQPGGARLSDTPPALLRLDKGDLLVDAAMAGLGVCQVLDFMTSAPLADGRLVEVLAEYATDGPVVHALCLPRRHRTAKVRAFLALLEQVVGKRAR